MKIYQREGLMAPTSVNFDAQDEKVDDLFLDTHDSYNIKEFAAQFKEHDWQDSWKSLDMTPDKLKVCLMTLFFILLFVCVAIFFNCYPFLKQLFKTWLKGTSPGEGVKNSDFQFPETTTEAHTPKNLNQKQELVYRYITHWVDINKDKETPEQFLLHVGGELTSILFNDNFLTTT